MEQNDANAEEIENCDGQSKGDIGSDYASETSSIASGMGDSTGDTTPNRGFQTPFAVKKPRKGKGKIDEELSEANNSISAMTQFFMNRTAAMAQPRPSAESTDEDGTFCSMLAQEFRKITQPAVKRKLKKAVYDALYEAQVADQEQAIQPPGPARYFIVQPAGSLTEVYPTRNEDKTV